MRFSEDRIEKLTCSDGIQRDIHIWEPESIRAVFLTVHGGMDHGGNYINPALFLKEHGFVTVAHDQHGHDMKRKVYIPRFEVFLDDLELMLEWVKRNYQEVPIFILSHSMGGLITTHFGLRRFKGDPQVKGFISSSPYYVNAIKTPKIMEKLAGLLSVLTPKMAVPIEDILVHVTHDETIYRRHREDEKDGIMAEKASARFASELLKAQAWIPEQIAAWKHPMLAIVAGDDKIANPSATRELLSRIDEGLLTELFYPDNYHENFNELNREEVFARIVEWCELRI
ncbi:MAG: alpha/beta hydrolase [Bacteroidales bacterium]|nr:alpha/beta hydrolase [Bacteroidales bacterium]